MIYHFETDINTLPVLNYYAFYKHYTIFDAGGQNIFQEHINLANQVIYKLRINAEPNKIIQELENSKVGLLESLNCKPRALAALACLCTKINDNGKWLAASHNVASDVEVEELGLQIMENLNVNYFDCITQIGLFYNQIQQQLKKAFPDLFPTEIVPFISAKQAILSIDLDKEGSLLEALEKIQATFYNSQTQLELIGNKVYEQTYWADWLALAHNLGFNQDDLQKNSIAFFFSALQNEKDKAKIYKEQIGKNEA